MTVHTFSVKGMSCEHCVQAVTTEVTKVSGVRRVSVDLERGAVTVTADGELDAADVAAAVEEAGYDLVR